MLEVARSYVASGLSCVAVRADGSKAPAVSAWKEYQTRRPVDRELRDWFGEQEEVGIAVLGGAASGNLEILDFDIGEAWIHWRSLVLPMLRQAGVRLPAMPVVETPGEGRHLFYRHAGEPQGNRKLARWTGYDKPAIETRGCNGYVVAPPSPARCHPANRPYVLLQGDLASIPTVSAEVRALFIEAACALNQVVEPERTVAPRPRVADGSRPGDIYGARIEWDTLLRRHGWRKTKQVGQTGYWLRPSSWRGPGHSATTNHGGSDLLYVFSTSTDFEANRGYSKFAAYAILDQKGDFHAAAQALAAAGYGAPRMAPTRTQSSTRSMDARVRQRMAGMNDAR